MFWCFLDLLILFLLFFPRLRFFFISLVHFSMPNSILTSWLYFIIVFIWVSSSFFFQTNILISSILLFFYPLQVFHTIVCRWFFDGSWVTSSRLRSPYFGQFQKCYRLDCLDPSSDFRLFQFPYLWEPLQARLLQMVSPSSLCFTPFLVFWHGPIIPLFSLSLIFNLSSPGKEKSTKW